MKRITLALFAAAIAMAAPEDQPGENAKQRRDPAKMFSRLDQSGDGKVSLEEFLAHKGRRHNAEQAENADRTAATQERRTAMFKKLDANADGFVTTDEFQSFAGKHGRRHQKPAEQQ